MAQDFRCWLRRAAGRISCAARGHRWNQKILAGALRSIGNPVQVRNGPAAVTGDERRKDATGRQRFPSGNRSRRAARSRIGPCGWEGAASRGIRESEDLPARGASPVDGERARILWRKGASLDRAKAVQGFFVIGGWPFGGKMERNRSRDCSFVCRSRGLADRRESPAMWRAKGACWNAVHRWGGTG